MQSGLNAPKFLWNANDFEYFGPNVDSLMDFLQSGDIYDEYGTYFTFDQFMNDELDGFIYLPNKSMEEGFAYIIIRISAKL